MPGLSRAFQLILFCGLALTWQVPVMEALASETVILVTTDEDELNADGDCSLREAIEAANLGLVVDVCLPGSGSNTISLPAGTYMITRSGVVEDGNQTGDLDIRANLSITGAGEDVTVIDANLLDRAFHIPDLSLSSQDPPPALLVVEISNVTIQNGLEQANGLRGGGGILNEYAALTLRQVTLQNNTTTRIGGGLDNAQYTTLLDSNLSMNQASNLSDTGKGGGIFNNGTLLIERTTLSGNSSDATGGALDNSNTATLIQAQVVTNSAMLGAGIHSDGILNVLNSFFLSDQAGSKGGGIYNSKGLLTVAGSTFQTNSAVEHGGGIFTDAGQLVLINSTLSGNQATDGGGIYSDGSVRISNSTLAYNSTGITHINIFSQAVIRNSMIVHSDGANCTGGGAYVSEANNLDSGDGCGFQLENSDPLLTALADNGGYTLTHAVQFGSPAIDAGVNETCPPADQRGYYRPADGDGNGSALCDIGAYEAGAVPVKRLYLPLISAGGER